MRKRMENFVLGHRNRKSILIHTAALFGAVNDRENLHENYGTIRGGPGAGKEI